MNKRREGKKRRDNKNGGDEACPAPWKKIIREILGECLLRYGLHVSSEVRFATAVNADSWGDLLDFGLAHQELPPTLTATRLLDAVDGSSGLVLPSDLAHDISLERGERRFDAIVRECTGPLLAAGLCIRYLIQDSAKASGDVALHEVAIASILITGRFNKATLASLRGSAGGSAKSRNYAIERQTVLTLARERVASNPKFKSAMQVARAIQPTIRPIDKKVKPEDREDATDKAVNAVYKMLYGQDIGLKKADRKPPAKKKSSRSSSYKE